MGKMCFSVLNENVVFLSSSTTNILKLFRFRSGCVVVAVSVSARKQTSCEDTFSRVFAVFRRGDIEVKDRKIH